MEHAACKCPKYIFTPWSCWLRRSRSSCQAANPHLMPLVCQVKTLCKMIPTAGSAAWRLGTLWGDVCEPWHISALPGHTGEPSLAVSIFQKAPLGVGFGLERNGAECGGPIPVLCCPCGDSPSTAALPALAVGFRLWLCVSRPLALGWAGTCLLVVWVWREQDGAAFVFTDIDIRISFPS